MNVLTMRTRLIENTKYSGSSGWRAKVDKMTDKQVIAIYYRLLNSGQIHEKEPDNGSYQLQMDIKYF